MLTVLAGLADFEREVYPDTNRQGARGCEGEGTMTDSSALISPSGYPANRSEHVP